MRCRDYLQDRDVTLRALEQYDRLARRWNWPTYEKMMLYGEALRAFDSNLDETTRRAAFATIYQRLRKFWQAGRNGALLPESETFDLLERHCHRSHRESGLMLPELSAEHGQEAVLECLQQAGAIKRLRSGTYPVMAVSKTLHFFNPRLWVIHDVAVIQEKVLPRFRGDLAPFWSPLTAVGADSALSSYVAYLLWAADAMRSRYAGLMDDFADWFISVSRDGADIREELKTHYATVFEFVIIGAAHLTN